MTVIAGVVSKDGVVIGADRMMSNCSYKGDSGPKVFEREGWAFANTGDVRTKQIFEKVTKGKKITCRDDAIEVAEEFYKELKEKGLGNAKDSDMPRCANCFLIATPTELFSLESNFAIYEHKNFLAHGIGMEYAMGVLHDGYGPDMDAVALVSRAIKAACALNPHCGGGPDIVRVAKKELPQTIAVITTEAGDGARK